MNEQLIVKKSYQVVTARMALDANEQNLLTLLVKELKLAATNYREDQIRVAKNNGLPILSEIEINPDDLPSIFEFELSELANVFGVTDSALSKTLDTTTTKMMQRVITWPLEHGGFYKEQLLGPSKYIKRKGKLSLQLHPRSKVAILEETRGVSIIDLKLSLSLKGGYEKRILDMISTFKNKRDFETSFSDFCEMVGSSPDDYKNGGLSDFRKVVIERPLKRIFKASNDAWEATDEKKKGYELIKSGRVVKKIVFKVKYNDFNSAKDISNIEEQERKKLEQQSTVDIAELISMEESILTIDKLDTFSRIMISGYQSITKDCGHQIPSNVLEKIKELTN